MNSRETIGISDAGGRGAALAHAYARSKHVRRIIGTPGNPTWRMNIPGHIDFDCEPSKLTDARSVVRAMTRNWVTLADICQDDAAAGGVVDTLQRYGYRTVGPTREAAMITEGSKIDSRDFMRRNLLLADDFEYHAFDSEQDGLDFLQTQDAGKGWAVKADGSAAGKGVIIAKDRDEAIAGVLEMKSFKDAGKIYLLEQLLQGEEFSAYAVCDGEHFKILGYAQDHKRALDGDGGLNTGGMGCYSNPSLVTDDIRRQTEEIFRKTFEGLAAEGKPYTGVLYLGAMVVDGKVHIIEYNARWGDPEAQAIIPGIKTDFVELADAVRTRSIDKISIETDDRVRAVLAMTSKGYPNDELVAAVKGKEIFGIQDLRGLTNLTFYGAGIREEGGRYFMNGGRVFYLVGEGKDIVEARDIAYSAMNRIRVEDDQGHYRRDIAHREMKRRAA